MTICEINQVTKTYGKGASEVHAVKGVSLTIEAGEFTAFVGPSGSGKTTVGRAISNILRSMSPDVFLGGEANISLDGQETQLNGLSRKEMLPWRAKVQMIFQDPFSSLNPRMTVQQLIERPMELHLDLSRAERKKRVEYLLDRVGLQPEYAARYPHVPAATRRAHPWAADRAVSALSDGTDARRGAPGLLVDVRRRARDAREPGALRGPGCVRVDGAGGGAAEAARADGDAVGADGVPRGGRA